MQVDITFRDIKRDLMRLPALLEEIRALRPHLTYIWGASVTLAGSVTAI